MFSHSGPKLAETELLEKLAKSFPVLWLTSELQAEMIDFADKSGVQGARDNLNGVGDIRIIGEDALINPDKWLAGAQLKTPASVLVFKQACKFANRLRKRKLATATTEVNSRPWCSSFEDVIDGGLDR